MAEREQRRGRGVAVKTDDDDAFDLAMQKLRGGMQGKEPPEPVRVNRLAGKVPPSFIPATEQIPNAARGEVVAGTSRDARVKIEQILAGFGVEVTAAIVNALAEAGEFSELRHAVQMLRRRGCTCFRPMFPDEHPGVKITIHRLIDKPAYRHWAKCASCSVNVFFERSFKP